MSNAIFPTLPGIVYQGRAPFLSTTVQRSSTGAELRVKRREVGRRYHLNVQYLRPWLGEHDTLFQFFESRGGQFDNFLFSDPDDSSVTSHGFGVGDGAKTKFQLQRALSGDTKPRTNLLPYSQDLTNAAWGGYNNGTGVAPVVTGNVFAAPDGTLTAAYLVMNKGSGTTNNDTCEYKHNTVPNGWPSPTQTYTGSIWLRTVDGSTVSVTLRLGSALTPIVVTPTWARYSVTRPVSSDGDATQLSLWLRGTYGTSDSANLAAWGAQLEVGSVATAYIPTTATAVTASPAYWTVDQTYSTLIGPAVASPMELVSEPDWGSIALAVNDPLLGPSPLLPASRTNLLQRSQEFDNAAWTKSASVTVDANALAAPDGTTTAERLNKPATAFTGAYQTGFMTMDRYAYTFSVYVRANSLTKASLRIISGTNDSSRVLDLNTGVITTGGSNAGFVSSTATRLGQWWRFTLTIITASTSTNIYVYPDDLNLAAAGAIYVWGAQFEVGPVATGYLPTTSAPVSRTDYTFTPNGLVTLAVPPASGAALTWSGNYYRRVRFADDELDLQLRNGIWSGSIELQSVI